MNFPTKDSFVRSGSREEHSFYLDHCLDLNFFLMLWFFAFSRYWRKKAGTFNHWRLVFFFYFREKWATRVVAFNTRATISMGHIFGAIFRAAFSNEHPVTKSCEYKHNKRETSWNSRSQMRKKKEKHSGNVAEWMKIMPRDKEIRIGKYPREGGIGRWENRKFSGYPRSQS